MMQKKRTPPIRPSAALRDTVLFDANTPGDTRLPISNQEPSAWLLQQPATSNRAAETASAPMAVPPVTLAGKMDAGRYVPENVAWFDQLTELVLCNGRSCRIGRDPMSIRVDILTAAGHPPRRTSRLVGALTSALDRDVGDLREYRDLRRHCLDCAENSAEVRRCAIIDCPFWPYRTGRNPHNPRRGKNPFEPNGVNVANGDDLPELAAPGSRQEGA
jgi:hypothetical protein